MTRKTLLLTSVVTCVCLALVWSAILTPPSLPKANFDSIRKGATETEVRRVFGTPTLVMDDGPHRMLMYEIPPPHPECSHAVARFFFDEHGGMREKIWLGYIPPTLFQRVRNWIQRPSTD